MGRLILMVRKDLLRKARSPLGLLVVLVFPILFSLLIALSFGGNDVPRVNLLVENHDEGFLGNALMSALASKEAAKHFDVEVVKDGGLERIGKGEGAALLLIPETFTQDVIDGKPTRLALTRNPAQGIMPEVAEQIAEVLTEGLSEASRVLGGPRQMLAPFTRAGAAGIDAATVARIAVAVHGTLDKGWKFLDPPAIALETVDLGAPADTSGTGFSLFLFVFPGVSVWALFMIGDVAMRDILAESEAGTLRRQLQGPIGTRALIAAKAAFTAAVALLGLVILTLTGWVASDRPIDPVGYVLLSLALVVAVTGAGATIYGATGSQTRGATVASVVYLTLGFAGGSFISLDALPRSVRAIAPFSPFYWATEGYKSLLSRGGGVGDVLPAAARLVALGAVLLVAGSFLLERRMRRGGSS